MATNKMLVVTTLYPYGQGEAFVEAELGQLTRCFDHIELVPVALDRDGVARPTRQPVNRTYAQKRWGLLRPVRVTGALLRGLARYSWVADLGFILRHDHKLDNLAELVRAIYRARLFESFLARLAREGEVYDLIYFYWLLPEILGALRFRQSVGGGMRIVSRAHGGDLYEDRKPGGYAGLQRRIIAGIDAIYCISQHGQRYLANRFPALARKFHLARLGVDDPGYLNRPPAGGPLQIVSCSFVVPGKRLHLIVDAIACMLAADPALQVCWTHVGDGPLFNDVQAYAHARLGGRGQAVFLGYQTQEQLRALYREQGFDVIVNVSDNEGIPVSLMEACAAGIPMVATDVGGSAEIVNATNGVLIRADADVATIAAAIRRFGDRRASLACRHAARAWWSARFNAARNYALFGQHLNGSTAPAAHEAAPDAAPTVERQSGSVVSSNIEKPCPKPHDDA